KVSARFPVLRRIDLVERSYANGLTERAYEYCKPLLSAGWLDPMGGCLGCYLALQRIERYRRGVDSEEMRLLRAASEKMLSQFEALGDSHVIQAEILSKLKQSDEAVKAYQEALQHGPPIIRDGLERLGGAIERHQIAHPIAELTATLRDQGIRGLL